MRKLALILIFFILVLSSNLLVAGKVYKCKTQTGDITYQNKPCTGNQNSAIVKINKAPENTETPWYEKNTTKSDSLTKDNIKPKPKPIYKKRLKSESQVCKSHKYFYEQIKNRGPLPGAMGRSIYKSQLATQKGIVDISCR